MTKAPESPDRPAKAGPVDAALGAAFRAVEAEPIPARLSDHLDELAATPDPEPASGS